MIKFKISSILMVDENDRPVGVVSKTDIMGAFYAGLPIERATYSPANSPTRSSPARRRW